MILFIIFAICSIIIFYAGKELVFYGNIISDKLGLGKAWAGLILIASVTSLPELSVGISSSAIIESADLAVGDVLGSCAFNLGILALIDVFAKKHVSVLSQASSHNSLAASLGIILFSMVGFSLYLDKDYVLAPWIGLTSLLFIAVYILAIIIMFEFERKNKIVSNETAVVPDKYQQLTLKKCLLRYTIFSFIVILVGISLPYLVNEIVNLTGMSETFAGTLFLAASTSLPEIAVSLSAIRMGVIDIAVGNIFGSNIFNIVILSIDDIFYQKGHILKDASDLNLISILSCIIMSAIAIIGLTYSVNEKRFWMAWDALLIFAVYIINMVLLYNLKL